MKIPASLYWRTKAMSRFKQVYKFMGDVESRLLKSDLQTVQIRKPIYISALARSGTTIITEMFSKSNDVCSHTYSDFPGVFTPYWKNWLQQKNKFLAGEKIVRAHEDRIMINNDSPEAFEEVIWMYFYPDLHNKNTPIRNILDNKEFINFYKNNIKKHLLVKNKTRYVSKANYNINRIEAILDVFPDAKFIVPIRHPVNHIASLIKQHNMYLKAAIDNPKIDVQLAASGHFEFGNNRRIVEMPGSRCFEKANEFWNDNQGIKGWAYYWNSIYLSLTELKQKSALLNNAIKIIKYEDLCNTSEEIIDELIEFCEFDHANFHEIKRAYINQLSLPDYYNISFNSQEINEIFNISQIVSDKFGYNAYNYN
jgi:hypothetical protein